jgi:hypothetical protein
MSYREIRSNIHCVPTRWNAAKPCAVTDFTEIMRALGYPRLISVLSSAVQLRVGSADVSPVSSDGEFQKAKL